MTTVLNLVGGERVGEPELARYNPADPSELVAVTPASDVVAMDAAVSAAEEAQGAWASLPAPARGAVLLDAADLLRSRQVQVAEDVNREEGKTLAEAMGEVRRAIDVLRFFGSLAWRASGEVLPSAVPGTTIFTRREPVGVVGLITPWNFPIAIPAWKMAPALVSGNAVVIKPAELTPLSLYHLSNALVEAGLPAGVLNVVHGKGSVVGDALAQDPRVTALSFTGSTAVGLGLHTILSERRARVQLEMGGKNAYLILDDADPSAAAKVVAASGFGLTGQACTATSRVYCTPGIKEPFLAALAKEAEAFTTGPVVSEQQLATDLAAIEQARAEDATVVAGGDVSSGQFLRPTVLTDLAHASPVVRDEIFGPIVAVLGVDSYEEGLARVNDSRYGLTAGICTRDLTVAHHFAAHVKVGVVKVNRPTTGLDLNVPFGGVKDSSSNTFREQGTAALDFYTWGKTVYLGHE